MKITANRTEYNHIKALLIENLPTQGSLSDSYLEGHILNSEHYEVIINDKFAGFYSIYDGKMLTQFFIKEEFRKYGQQIFEVAKRTDHVLSALISTGDELFLSHAIERAKRVETQAYFFKAPEKGFDMTTCRKDLTLRLATVHDEELILEKSGDFFDDVPKQLKNKELYVGTSNGQVVSFGIIEESKMYNNVGSTGMFVVPEHRSSGIGRSTILKLIDICGEKNITPIAGCGYYNHNSKKTLESAGYYTQTRLMNIKL